MRNFIDILELPLSESSNDDLATVVKRLKAHPAVAPMMRRGFSPYGWGPDYNSIDHAEAAKAFRDIVLHNHNAREFMRDHHINLPRDLSRYNMADLDAEDNNAIFFHSILDFVKAATKHLSMMKKGEAKISAQVKKDLVTWAETNGHRHVLPIDTMRTLLATPFIRPDKPTVLYRGILLSRKNDRNAAWFDAIEADAKVTDHTWERASSWTTSKDTAEKFARYLSANTEYSAMFTALSRKGKIDGELGIIVSTLARPEDIVADLRKIDLGHTQHGDEGEMILRPGEYRVRIVQHWTKDEG